MLGGAVTVEDRRAGQRAARRNSTRLWLAVRIAGTVLCFAVILWRLDLGQLAALFAHPRWAYLVLCVSLTPLLIFVSVWRWRILLRTRGAELRFGAMLRVYVIGCFLNQLLPSTFGGDLFRIYGLARHSTPTHVLAASVIVDRLVGFVVVLLAAAAGWVAVAVMTGECGWVVAAISVFVAIAAFLWFLAEAPLERLRSRRSAGVVGRIVGTLASWHASIREYGKHTGTLWIVTAVSVVFLALNVLNFWFAALAFQSGIGLGRILLIVPSVVILGSLPVSLGGWGLQELSAALVFDFAGYLAAVGLSAALLIRFKNLVVALIGGILYAAAPHDDGAAPERGKMT
jgi:uncharacterized protein (TIRG00374 family)